MAVRGLGIAAPGLENWRQAAAVLRGEAPYEPAPMARYKPALLPRNETRRAGNCVRLAFQAAEQACEPAGASGYASIFASAGGDLDISHRMCEAVTSEARAVSPTHFHNSVHNAAAGYWSIATGSRCAANSLAAAGDSFCLALLDAWSWLANHAEPVLLVCYESEGGGLIARARPGIHASFAVALALHRAGDDDTRYLEQPGFTGGPATELAEAELETFRRSNPAARSLPLLELLARGEAGRVVLESGQGNLALALHCG